MRASTLQQEEYVLHHRVPVVRSALAACAATVTLLGLPSLAAAATTYSPGTPAVDGVLNGPWNNSQGDPANGSSYLSAGGTLFPTYTPGGATTSVGGVTEPNLAVYPGASTTNPPYPSGYVGTPGPVDGYCDSTNGAPGAGSMNNEPTNTKLPMAPYYFPDIVRNSDGSLTGYFDWRPKATDEAITVAKSTDNGATWTTEGIALENNAGYCSAGDASDAGEGHPYVTSVGGHNYLYTLGRPAGDNTDVGLLVHSVNPSASDPLSGLPASEPVGIDPNTFATSPATVPTSGGVAIPVSLVGTYGASSDESPENIGAGDYEDANATSPSTKVITCTGTATSPADELTGCTVVGGSPLSVSNGDDLLQVFATATGGGTIPATSSQDPAGTGGLANLPFTDAPGAQSAVVASELSAAAPSRLYIDGHPVYCVNATAAKLEYCTSPDGSFSFSAGDAITADPIVPPNAEITTGLLAPDGIVGTVPYRSTFLGQSVPSGASIVLYTEKLLNYYIVGTVNGYVSGSTYHAGAVTLPASEINYSPSTTTNDWTAGLPSGTFTIFLGSTANGNSIQTVTCTGAAPAAESGVPSHSVDLTGCTGGAGSVASGNDVGGPGAAIAPSSALTQIGEGSASPKTLFKNNEDLTVLRAAYTTDGVDFTDLGPISGSTSGNGATSGSYTDVSNPNQQEDPQSDSSPTTATLTPASPVDLTQGSADQIELRYVGSRGTTIVNPDGSVGMFLSGAWSSDGDSDAFNQIFYTSSSDGGQTWSVPTVVLSTDYTFSASEAQDPSGTPLDNALGISAYYSGRAYGPTVVQNPDGSLTLVFAGYRTPKPVPTVGTAIGTGSPQYTVGAEDPALYRSILTDRLTSSTSPPWVRRAP